MDIGRTQYGRSYVFRWLDGSVALPILIFDCNLSVVLVVLGHPFQGSVKCWKEKHLIKTEFIVKSKIKILQIL